MYRYISMETNLLVAVVSLSVGGLVVAVERGQCLLMCGLQYEGGGMALWWVGQWVGSAKHQAGQADYHL